MTHAFALSAEVANLPAIGQLIGDIKDLQSKLILLVGRSGKTRLLHALARQLNAEPLNVGVALGRRLAVTPIASRSFSTNELLREITDEVGGDAPLLLDNLEVLFEPSLRVNPLNVTKLLAHSRRVIAAWPGELRNDRLTYASVGHPEHRDYSRDGVVVFETTQRP